MNRKEPQLTPAFSKDPDEEDFLRQLNEILAPSEEADYRDLPERLPTLHILGAPRSGTTLLHQVVASCLDVGYINNLIAAFWRAPVYGIRLSRKLLAEVPVSSFRSRYGRTSGIHEPHEFGYFWSSVLGYDEMRQRDAAFEDQIDWARLRSILINMAEAFGRPLVLKPFLLAWHIARLQAVMPKACFVWIRRDPLQTALSIVELRKKYAGSLETWVGLKPAEYAWLKDEPYWTQVAGQVCYIEKSIRSQIEAVGGRNVLTIDYEDFAENPKTVLRQIQELLGHNGFRPDSTSQPPTSFTTRRRTPQDSEDYERVRQEVERFSNTPATQAEPPRPHDE